MKITSLVVEGAGRFGTPVSVQGLGDGVNILAAGNEAGKSTLFRAIRACLFERHNTRNRSVSDLCTRGLSLPLSVTLGFDQGGAAYSIQKSFIRSPSACLRREGVEIARGRQADDDLWEILGVAPGGGRSVDEAAFGLLWVSQGHSFQAPQVAGAVADEISAIVQQEVGVLVGGERARAVLGKLRAEIDTQLTANTGQPRANGPLGKALAMVENVKATLVEARRRQQGADEHIVTLEGCLRERAQLSDPATGPRIRTDLEEAEKQLKDANAARSILLRLEATEQRAEVAATKASAAFVALQDCINRIDVSRTREATIGGELLPLVEQVSQIDRLIADARARIGVLQVESRKDDATQRSLNELASALTRHANRADLTARLEFLGDTQARLLPIQAELKSNGASAQLVEQIDGCERDLATLAARVEAGAAQISVEIDRVRDGRVSVDGVVVDRPISKALLARTVIQVGDIATITASPPTAFGAAEFERREAVAMQLASALAEAAAASPVELRQAHVRRKALESDLAALLAELRAVGIDQPGLPNETARLTAEIAAADATVAAVLASAQLSHLPDAEDIGRQEAELSVRKDAANLERDRLGGVIEAQSDVRGRASNAMAHLEGERAEILRTRAIDLATVPDDAREASLAAATQSCEETARAHRISAGALENQLTNTPGEEEVERLESRCTRLREAIEGQRDRANKLEVAIVKLEVQIAAVGAEGLGERIASLSEECELCTREAARLRARTEALVLLRDTIERCLRNQRDRLNAPVVKHLQPFLTDLFPNATPEIGDAFAITGLRRDGPDAEPFEILSDGTREQIAVLVRLAMGSMLCERGAPVPVILDDALVFSDDDRIERMFDALNRAGQRQQVIVLTCRMRTFATLGGRQLSIER